LFVRGKKLVWIAVALAALLVWQRGALLRIDPKPEIAPRPERLVLRVWICENWMGSTAWIEKQCALFQRAHPGVNLRVRRAQISELTAEGAVLPDLLLFAPGVLADPQALLSPIHGELPIRDEIAAAGRWRGRQWGVPIAMGGYALLVNNEGFPDPEQPVLDQENLAAATQPAKGKQPARYALQCASGETLAYPAALLAQGGALSGGWPQGIAALRGGDILPGDFALCTIDKAYADFTARRVMALLGTQRDLRKFSALTEVGKGFDFRVVPPRQVFTDQLLLGGILQGAKEELCAELLWQLVGAEAQQALTEYGLFPVRGDVTGYNANNTPWLHAMALSLATEDIWVPNAFEWGEERKGFLARVGLALAQGGVDLMVDGAW